jgi:hypothetical protein
MTAPSEHASADAVELGALLVLLHGADAPVDTVEAIYRLWRHRERAHAAFLADAEQQKRRGASITLYGPGKAEPEPAEQEETVRIWRAGERARVEHHGGERDGYYAVADGPLWWMWDERNGAHSNRDDPSVGSGIGEELQIMLNPVPLLRSLSVSADRELRDRRPTDDQHTRHPAAARHPSRASVRARRARHRSRLLRVRGRSAAWCSARCDRYPGQAAVPQDHDARGRVRPADPRGNIPV